MQGGTRGDAAGEGAVLEQPVDQREFVLVGSAARSEQFYRRRLLLGREFRI